jgi:hypothetical protein
LVDRAWSAQLISTASDRLKVQSPQYLLHRDLGAQAVEVNPGHGLPLARVLKTKEKEGRSVPSSI